jgi:hypothetical protein
MRGSLTIAPGSGHAWPTDAVDVVVTAKDAGCWDLKNPIFSRDL